MSKQKPLKGDKQKPLFRFKVSHPQYGSSVVEAESEQAAVEGFAGRVLGDATSDEAAKIRGSYTIESLGEAASA
jgi:hypothetical protein